VAAAAAAAAVGEATDDSSQHHTCKTRKVMVFSHTSFNVYCVPSPIFLDQNRNWQMCPYRKS